MKLARWYRSSADNILGWEIFGWKEFYLTFCIGSFELQVNKYLSDNPES
jgi:hypothetical protein